MIRNIFSNNFYSLFAAPNRGDIFESLKNIKVDRVATKKVTWNTGCNVDVEILDKEAIENLFLPSLNIFFSKLESNNTNVEVKLLSVWRNTYQKGGFQDMHDHLDGDDEECHLSGCFFLDDYHKDAGNFYFYNRHSSEVPVLWRRLNTHWPSLYVEQKAGDILFFPSYMLHGVSLHKIRKPRTTISFNMKIEIV